MMNNEDPKIWGAHFWFVMRKVAERFPVSDPAQELQNAARAMFESLKHLLPCEKCREHYVVILESYPIDVTNRASMMKWVEQVKHEVDKTIAESRKADQVERFLSSVPPKAFPVRRPVPPGRTVPNSVRPFQAMIPASPARFAAPVTAPVVARTAAATTATTATPKSVQPRHANPRPIQKQGCSSCSSSRNK